MKKLISLLTAMMIFTISAVGATRYKDVPDGASYAAAVENLSNYGIISGYNGNFNPNGFITRAEAAKIAVVTYGIEDKATEKAGAKKFNDVEIGDWSCGYINAASDSNIILGYPNGYFGPNNNITYAEMTTIVLRLLGYNSATLGDNWPYAYMVKAEDIGITDGVNLSEYDAITRAQTCVLIDNALSKTVYGSDIRLSDKVSKIKYSDPVVITSSDPYVSLSSLGINKNNIEEYTIIRDGYRAKVSDIEVYDVAYKSESNKTIYIYCDKITGVYKEAKPSKADITSADISGNILELETQTAKDKLGEKSGSFKINSRITALIGKDGKIVDVIDMNSSGNSAYGVLLSTSQEVSTDVYSKGEQKNYINILSGDGKTVSHQTIKDYSNYVGFVGKIDFDDNAMAEFTTVSGGTKLSGDVDKANNKIGNNWLTADATLIELVYEPENHTGEAIAKVIDIDDISIETLYNSNVVYALTTGDFDDVSFAVLKNVTNNSYSYGILKKSNVVSVGMALQNSSYTIVTDGKEMQYLSSFAKDFDAGTPVAFIAEGSSIKTINKLNFSPRGKLNAIDELRVKIGNDIYTNADDLQIYSYSFSRGYTRLSVEGAQKHKGENAAVYTDANSVSGGLVRVVIIFE